MMTKLGKIIATLSGVAATILLNSGTLAQENNAPSLESMLEGIQTLAAEVTQLILESDGGTLEESQIQMYLKKPDSFYWETLSPFPELVLISKGKLWNYVPDLEQVVVEDWDWDSDRSELAAQLLSGRTQNLAEEYTIERVSSVDSDAQEFELTPIASDSVYEQISINFAGAELDMIYLDSKNGQQTVWRFDSTIRNEPLDDALFDFQVPENVELIENN